MDKIIEEYITLDFINNEMLFNKKNYDRTVQKYIPKKKEVVKVNDSCAISQLKSYGVEIGAFASSFDVLANHQNSQSEANSVELPKSCFTENNNVGKL